MKIIILETEEHEELEENLPSIVDTYKTLYRLTNKYVPREKSRGWFGNLKLIRFLNFLTIFPVLEAIYQLNKIINEQKKK